MAGKYITKTYPSGTVEKVWTRTTPRPAPPPKRTISTANFLDRLGDAALDDIVASNIPAAQSFVLRLQLAGSVNLDAPAFNAALDRLRQVGLITAAERTAATA